MDIKKYVPNGKSSERNLRIYKAPGSVKFANEFYISKTWKKSERRKAIRLLLKPKEGEKFLDAGCALGVWVREFARKGCESVGVDYCESFIKRARELKEKRGLKNCKFEVMDITKLSYKDDSFDWVLCSEVLEHIEDVRAAVKELVRVASKYLVVTVPVRGLITLISDAFVAIVERIKPFDTYFDRFLFFTIAKYNKYTHLRYYSQERIRHLFRGLPVEVDRIEHYSRFHFKNGVIVRLKKVGI